MNTNTQSDAALKVSVLDRTLRILHLEDDENDRSLIQRWIHVQNVAAEFTDVANQKDFTRLIEENAFDIILSDKTLPGFDGLEALRVVREKFPYMPFIFVTGSMGEEAAISTVKDGATDYVLKGRLQRLVPALQRAIHDAEQDERNRKIGETNREQAALLDKAQDAILMTDVEDQILFWNKSAERIYGWPASSALGRKAAEILATDRAKYLEAKQILMEKGSWTGETIAANKGGNELIVEGRWTLVRDEQGSPKSILMIATDITEKKALETKFLRSQRMDSIGALAGGIAHDLNNALAPVLMCAEILRDTKDEVERQKFLDLIVANTERATDMVKHILSFARGSGGQSLPVKLSHLIAELGKMIQDTFPKSIVLSVNSDPALRTVQGDATELHQVLLNLCVNARDAMPQGGVLTLSARNVIWDAAAAAATNATPGLYVMISVADTGTGIPLEVLPRIFEPFFTTKNIGKGTGLGLSTVCGIVKRHGGFMDIQTKPGKGTEFQVYLPAAASVETAETNSKKAEPLMGHNELILLIDDEEALLELTKTMLESYGYRVVTAPNGVQGIGRFKANVHEINLVITDSDMPHMDGSTTIRGIRELKRDIPIIMTSGYNQDASESAKLELRGLQRLEKPYSLDRLLTAVNMALRLSAVLKQLLARGGDGQATV